MPFVWNKGYRHDGRTYEIVTRIEDGILVASLFCAGKMVVDFPVDAAVISVIEDDDVELPAGVFYANFSTAYLPCAFSSLLTSMVSAGYLERVDGFPIVEIGSSGDFYRTYRVVDR